MGPDIVDRESIVHKSANVGLELPHPNETR